MTGASVARSLGRDEADRHEPGAADGRRSVARVATPRLDDGQELEPSGDEDRLDRGRSIDCGRAGRPRQTRRVADDPARPPRLGARRSSPCVARRVERASRHARRRGADGDPRRRARARSRSPSRSRCGRPAPRRSSRSGFLRTEGLIERPTRSRASRSATRPRSPSRTTSSSSDCAGRSTPRGRRAPLRRDGQLRDLRQGVDRRDRRPLRPAAARPAVGRPDGAHRPAAIASVRRSSSSTRPAACTRRACSRPTASSSRSARTSAATTRSTSSSAPSSSRGRLPLHDRVLLVSGRVSFEIVQKAAVAGIAFLCARSRRPSDLAVEAAERLGVTLVGFLRGDGFNVYTGRERIAGI